MRAFRVFVQKEFYHILRDRWTTIILLALPILMIILFGFGITTEIRNTKFAVYDPAGDFTTRGIINKLESSEYFTLERYLSSPDQIEQLFREGKTGFAVVFSDEQILLVADGTDPNTASILTNYATALINSYLEESAVREAGGGAATNVAGDPPVAAATAAARRTITPEIRLLYNPSLKSAYNIVPGIMGMILMLICAMMTSVSIAREKELGTMEVLLVSPMKPFLIILSKIVPYFTISVINYVTILILSVYVLNVPIAGSLILLSGLSLLFIMVSLLLGILISSLVEKQIVALLISGMLLMMPAVFLSGLMFPIESMPEVLQWLSHILPVKWFIIAVRNVMIKGLGFSSIIKEIAILTGMAAVILAVSIKKFKFRLE
ncbi:Ribosome-associated ATPase [bioreactor metagenome]|uniref:Ribosome-associated ATPase n=1 Tax=bioreactor metagenome TaxID=1076179 RepID=A0A644W6C9_9ZZZZ|nr:ABC transporter permease [Bacteroidales bacterium MB20-C3-3]